MTKNKRPTQAERIEAEIHRLASQVRWFIGIGLAIFAIMAGFLVLRPDPVEETLAEIRRLNRGYDPVFRRVMLDRAYSLLSEVHITEIQHEGELNRNLQEIKESLSTVGAFDGRNAGLLRIFELLEAVASGGDPIFEEEFLATQPLKDITLNMTPQEAGYFITFQGLLYIDRMRANPSRSAPFRKYLELALERLTTAQRLNTGIPNMWNGLGIIYLDLAHESGDLPMINQARYSFQLAYELHRSPINFAAKMNNHAYATMLARFHETIIIRSDSETGELVLLVRSKVQARDQYNQMIDLLQSFETALTYDPNALSILLSKAELLCNISLLSQFAAGPEMPDGIEVPNVITVQEDEYLEQAMSVIREARVKGFDDWEYLFSRVWIAQTLFRVEKYREELSGYIEH